MKRPKHEEKIRKKNCKEKFRKEVPGHQLRQVEGSLSARKRMKLALFLGASDLNLSKTLSKLETVASDKLSGIWIWLAWPPFDF